MTAKIQISTIASRRVARAVSASSQRTLSQPASTLRKNRSTTWTISRVARKMIITVKKPGMACRTPNPRLLISPPSHFPSPSPQG